MSSPEQIDADIISTLTALVTRMEAISERMNYFEAWFANAFDRIGTTEKQLESIKQQFLIWIEGRK